MPQPTRRTNGQPTSTRIDTSSTKPDTTTTSQSTRSRTPFFLLAIYPAILLTGSLFSILEPHARAAPYSTQLQSHPPSEAPSYFARKSNILNQYFVKILWIWITAAFGLFLLLHPLTGKPLTEGFTLSRRRIQAFLRYAVVTGLWIVTTQWFFGPALVDRNFRLTGGKCEMVAQGGLRDEPIEEFVTAAACKLAGGSWAGGHDISGHVFILILGSAFLTFEAWPILEVIAARGWAVLEERKREEIDNGRDDGFTVGKEGDEREWGLSMGVISGVVGTALWMLLMTATYFHTWFEKLTGLIVAFSGLGLVYILPRFVPALETILGRPGI